MTTHNTRDGSKEVDELVKEFKNQFRAWQTTSNQPYPIFVEWFEREIKKIYRTHHQELEKDREEAYNKAVNDCRDCYSLDDLAHDWDDKMKELIKPRPDKSELDQPKPIEIPVKGTKIDCKEHGANQIVIKDGAGWCGECLKKSELDQAPEKLPKSSLKLPKAQNCYCKDKAVIELIEENKKDWLREEIEFVKQVQAVEPDSNGRYNACNEIMKRYQSELDQPSFSSVPEAPHYAKVDGRAMWAGYKDGIYFEEPYMHQDEMYSNMCASPKYCRCSE